MVKRRQDIPPVVLLVIGLIVGVSSIFINVSSESNFLLFIVAGFGMAGYGLVKFALSVKTGKSEKETEKSHHGVSRQHEHPHHKQHHQHGQHAPHHQNVHNHTGQGGKNSSFSFCPGCGGRLPANVNFCPHCGARLH